LRVGDAAIIIAIIIPGCSIITRRRAPIKTLYIEHLVWPTKPAIVVPQYQKYRNEKSSYDNSFLPLREALDVFSHFI
jgi:hypothetical protein